jgi:von Willebrand factor A domain-containing protein 5
VKMPGQVKEESVFIFLVDRSGSMSGQKMEMTKEALKLFIQSLPPGCLFEIISFGSSYSFAS